MCLCVCAFFCVCVYNIILQQSHRRRRLRPRQRCLGIVASAAAAPAAEQARHDAISKLDYFTLYTHSAPHRLWCVRRALAAASASAPRARHSTSFNQRSISLPLLAASNRCIFTPEVLHKKVSLHLLSCAVTQCECADKNRRRIYYYIVVVRGSM